MSTTRHRIPFTYEDYKSLPESLNRYELMDGELHMVPAPTTTHQTISQNIEFLLVRHVRATGSGRVFHAPVDLVLGEGVERDVVQPDIVFVSRERMSIVTEPELVGAPDLVVEILSKSTADRDRGYKKTLYERSGVREYWIVDPDARCIDVFTLGAEGFGAAVRYRSGDRLKSRVVDGFELAVAEVFEGDGHRR